MKCNIKGKYPHVSAMCGYVIVGDKSCSLPPNKCRYQAVDNINVSPWLVVDGYCATRIVEGGSVHNVIDRVAFIEKTPRVRIAGYPIDGDSCDNFESWRQGPKGNGGSDGENPDNELYGFYPDSREWCDEQLVELGYVLPD